MQRLSISQGCTCFRSAMKTPNPLALRNDEVKDTSIKTPAEKSSKVTDIKIDLDGIGNRIISLPIDPSNYGTLYAKGDVVYYLKQTQVVDKETHLMVYSFKDRKETDLGAFDDYQVAANGEKMLLKKGDKFSIIDITTSPAPSR